MIQKINPEAPIIIMTTEVYRNMAATGQFNFDQNNKKGIPNGVRTVILMSFNTLVTLTEAEFGNNPLYLLQKIFKYSLYQQLLRITKKLTTG